MTNTGTTAVIEVSGVHWASSKPVTEAVLGRRPGVTAVDANPVSQTATVTYDPARTSVAELSGWVRDCGYHCAGQSVPDHVCDPMAEPTVTNSMTAARQRPSTTTTKTPTTRQRPPDTSAITAPRDSEPRRTRWRTAAITVGCRWTT